MKVTKEKIENSQVALTIEMESAEVEEWLGKSYSRLVKKMNIPGFRKGKAPRAILEQYIGRGALFDDALENLVPHAYEQAIKEQRTVLASWYAKAAEDLPRLGEAEMFKELIEAARDYHAH